MLYILSIIYIYTNDFLYILSIILISLKIKVLCCFNFRLEINQLNKEINFSRLILGKLLSVTSSMSTGYH